MCRTFPNIVGQRSKNLEPDHGSNPHATGPRIPYPGLIASVAGVGNSLEESGSTSESPLPRCNTSAAPATRHGALEAGMHGEAVAEKHRHTHRRRIDLKLRTAEDSLGFLPQAPLLARVCPSSSSASTWGMTLNAICRPKARPRAFLPLSMATVSAGEFVHRRRVRCPIPPDKSRPPPASPRRARERRKRGRERDAGAARQGNQAARPKPASAARIDVGSHQRHVARARDRPPTRRSPRHARRRLARIALAQRRPSAEKHEIDAREIEADDCGNLNVLGSALSIVVVARGRAGRDGAPRRARQRRRTQTFARAAPR